LAPVGQNSQKKFTRVKIALKLVKIPKQPKQFLKGVEVVYSWSIETVQNC
jgi:hypothetical protein